MRRVRLLPVLMSALATLPPSAAAQEMHPAVDGLPRVLPFDEGPRDPAFFAFRARLQQAVIDRDTAALMAAVDPRIHLSFGGDTGAERFREWLSSERRDYWSELGAVLALGGGFRGDSAFIAPYVHAADLPADTPDQYRGYDGLFVIGDVVPVYADPDTSLMPVATLSFHLVRREWKPSVADPPPGWTAVYLADDSLRYVESVWLRSPIDYRAYFIRRDGRWRMSIFIAGD